MGLKGQENLVWNENDLGASSGMVQAKPRNRTLHCGRRRCAISKKQPLAATCSHLAATCSSSHLAATCCSHLGQVSGSGCQVAAKWLPSGCQVAAKWLPSGCQVAAWASGCLSKWQQVAASSCKWLQVAAWAGGCKWLLVQVAASGCKWLQVAASGCLSKWLQLNEWQFSFVFGWKILSIMSSPVWYTPRAYATQTLQKQL